MYPHIHPTSVFCNSTSQRNFMASKMSAFLNFNLLSLLPSIFNSHIEARGSLCGNRKFHQGRVSTLWLEVVCLGRLDTMQVPGFLASLLWNRIRLPDNCFGRKLENCIPLLLYYFLPVTVPVSLDVDFIPSWALTWIIVQFTPFTGLLSRSQDCYGHEIWKCKSVCV